MSPNGEPSRRAVSDNLIVFDIGKSARCVKGGSSIFEGHFVDFEDYKTFAVKRLQLDPSKPINKDESIFLLQLAGHPNILKFYCTYVQPDFMYIVTELCDGTLEDLIEDDAYNGRVGDEREILLQITRGVAYLHESGIVHRDIKPGNIFFTKEYGSNVRPRMKLADFGISCHITNITNIDDGINADDTSSFDNDTIKPWGTIGWTAPELYDSSRCDVKVDTFSLGLVYGYTLSIGYTLSNGVMHRRHPFDGESRDPDGRLVIECLNISRQDNINNDKMNFNNDDLKENYRKDNIAFKLIESMLERSPKNRPTLNDILSKKCFLNNAV